MSTTGTPIRTPLRELASNETRSVTPSRCNFRTPKTSPGPALLLALKLSAKKKLIESSRLNFDEKENYDEKPLKDSRVAHFREVLSSETERITELCCRWEEVLSESKSDKNNSPTPTDAVLGDIRTTVGQGRLIIRERFHQFEGLVDNCEFGTSEKPVTCEDLQGFWDMIYFQVEDVNTKFGLLEKCRECGWDTEILKPSATVKSDHQKKTVKKKKMAISKGSSAASKARKEMLAEKRAEARKRLAAARAEMKRLTENKQAKETKNKEETVTFDAGFFKVDSPAKSPLGKITTPSAANRTPRGTCLRKQVCTPGSVTKSLKSMTSNSPVGHAKLPTSDRKTLLPLEKTSSPIVSKKLGFAETPQKCCDATECLVEILLTDQPPLAMDYGAHTSTPLENGPVIEALSIGHTDFKQRIVTSELSNFENICATTDFSSELDNRIALSPPAAFANFQVAEWSAEAGTDLEARGGKEYTVDHGAIYLHKTRIPTSVGQTTSNKNCGGSVSQTRNETFELQDGNVADQDAPLIQTGNGTSGVERPDHTVGHERNLTFEIPQCASVIKTSVTETNSTVPDNRKIDCFPKVCSAEEHQDLDASNMSILIDEATKNIEKASEILKDSPRREVQKNQKARNLLVKSVNDAATSITPSGKSNKRDDILLETLQKVAGQMENLQKLNNSHLQTPSRLKQKESTLLKKVDQLQSKVASLEVQNSHLKASLDDDKRNQSITNICDVEKTMQLLFDSKDDSSIVPDSSYKPHYYRLLAKVKVLEAKLQAYDEAESPLMELNDQIRKVHDKLEEKSHNVKETSLKLEKRESALAERERRDNEELLECRRAIQDLEEQLVTIQETLSLCEKEKLEGSSSLDTLRVEHESAKKEKEALKHEIAKIKQENFSFDEKNAKLEEKLETLSTMHDDQRKRADALDQKVKCLGQEIESAFSEFNSNIQQRDEMISSHQKEIEDLNSANTRLFQDSKALQDRIETLEYVEDELRSLQEQLNETEVSLKDSNTKSADKDGVIEKMGKEVDALQLDIKDKNLQVSSLQEELDVAKSEAHFMVQQREEELTYGKTGLDQILEKMNELNSTLRRKIAEENFLSSSQIGLRKAAQLETPFTRSLEAEDAVRDFGQAHAIESDTTQHTSKVERAKSWNQDSIIWRVEDSAELLQSIINSCGNLQLKFQKEIDSLDFNNAVLQKQLAASKEKLSGLSREENELEQVLRKRIEKLIKEGEEKSAKLECNSRTMRMLSDQNLALTNYKMKYEELTGNPKSSRRGRSVKRRSSSAGSLKFLP